MDDDDLRRGRPSCHAAFNEATAILAGDALLTQAFEILARDIQPATRGVRCCVALAQAAGKANMVGGQCDDLHIAAQVGSLELLESIHRRKTGAMFTASLEIGGLVAGADDLQLRRLKTYGNDIGLAFQIIDDLLDCEGNERALGKRTQKDSARGKLTFPGFMGFEASRQRVRQLVGSACQAIAPFGSAGEALISLAQYLQDRDH